MYSTLKLVNVTGHSKKSTQLVVYNFRKKWQEIIALNILIGCLKNSLVYGHSSKPLEQLMELEIVALDGEIRRDLPMKQ